MRYHGWIGNMKKDIRMQVSPLHYDRRALATVMGVAAFPRNDYGRSCLKCGCLGRCRDGWGVAQFAGCLKLLGALMV